MKALVVGGTGFVGMNVVRALVARGHDVCATRRTRANTLFARKLGARLVVAELDDAASLTEAMRGREVVFHCAGIYPRYSLDGEAQIARARRHTENVMAAAAAAGVSRVVLTSSVATIGKPPRPELRSTEEDAPDEASLGCVYHAIKWEIERTALSCRQGPGVVVLCPTGIFGELDVKAGTGFVIVAVGNRALPYHVDGPIDVVSADDVAEAHLLAAERGRDFERYIVSGEDATVRRVLEASARALDVPLVSWPLPLAVARALATVDELRASHATPPARPFLPRELVDMVEHARHVDRSKATRELGLPRPAPLERTIGKAAAWYLAHRYVRPDARTRGRPAPPHERPNAP